MSKWSGRVVSNNENNTNNSKKTSDIYRNWNRQTKHESFNPNLNLEENFKTCDDVASRYLDSIVPTSEDEELELKLSIGFTKRVLSWGTVLPMCSLEKNLHNRIPRALGLPVDVTKFSWRPLYSFGTWRLGGKSTVSIILTHPCIATSSLVFTHCTEAKAKSLNPAVDILSPPRDGSSNIETFYYNGAPKLVGRCAMYVNAIMEQEDYDYEEPRCDFVVLTASALTFVIAHKTRTMLCRCTDRTLSEILSSNHRGIVLGSNDNSIRVHGESKSYPQNRISSSDSLGICNDGRITFQGHPRRMYEVYRSLYILMVSCMQDPMLRSRIVSSLEIFNDF